MGAGVGKDEGAGDGDLVGAWVGGGDGAGVGDGDGAIVESNVDVSDRSEVLRNGNGESWYRIQLTLSGRPV